MPMGRSKGSSVKDGNAACAARQSRKVMLPHPPDVSVGGAVDIVPDPMQRIETRLDGPILVEPKLLGDERGFFHETYRRNVFAELGIHEELVQDNHSRSGRGIVRGMHFQIGRGAAKLVRCGARRHLRRRRRPAPRLADVRAVGGLRADRREPAACSTARSASRTASACSATSPTSSTSRTAYYADATERGIAYDDPDVGIEWPLPLEELMPSAARRERADAARDRGRAALRLRG